MNARRIVIVLLLATSVALNAAWLLTRAAPPPAASASPAQGAVSPPSSAPPVSLERHSECEQALKECRAPAAAWAGLAPELMLPRAPADAGLRAIDARSATPELQQELLSQIAREHLRREWAGKQDDVVRGVLKDLRDPAKQRRDLEKDLEQYARTLGLSSTDALRAAYEPIRTRRMQQLERLLSKDAPDFSAVLAELRGLYSDEDRLVTALAGTEAATRFRLSQLEKRTVILGIASTFAQLPWDQAIWPPIP